MQLSGGLKSVCKVAAMPVDAPSTAARVNAELLAQRPPSFTAMMRRNISDYIEAEVTEQRLENTHS